MSNKPYKFGVKMWMLAEKYNFDTTQSFLMSYLFKLFNYIRIFKIEGDYFDHI